MTVQIRQKLIRKHADIYDLDIQYYDNTRQYITQHIQCIKIQDIRQVVQQNYQKYITRMSTFPDILRSTKSVYFKPIKQGGIYSLNLKPKHCQVIQPQEYTSAKYTNNNINNDDNGNDNGVYHKLTNSNLVETVHTARNNNHQRHNRNLSLGNFNRKVVSSQANRPGLGLLSQMSTSRPFTNQAKNYNKKLIIKQQCNTSPTLHPDSLHSLNTHQNPSSTLLTPSSTLLTPSSTLLTSPLPSSSTLSHKLTTYLTQTQALDSQLFSIVVQKDKIHSRILRMYDDLDNQIKQIKQYMYVQLVRMRSMLSKLRRQSLEQVKVNRIDVSKLGEEMRDIREVVGQVQGRSLRMYQECLN